MGDLAAFIETKRTGGLRTQGLRGRKRREAPCRSDKFIWEEKKRGEGVTNNFKRADEEGRKQGPRASPSI